MVRPSPITPRVATLRGSHLCQSGLPVGALVLCYVGTQAILCVRQAMCTTVHGRRAILLAHQVTLGHRLYVMNAARSLVGSIAETRGRGKWSISTRVQLWPEWPSRPPRRLAATIRRADSHGPRARCGPALNGHPMGTGQSLRRGTTQPRLYPKAGRPPETYTAHAVRRAKLIVAEGLGSRAEPTTSV